MLKYKMNHFGHLVRVDMKDKRYTCKENTMHQHLKMAGRHPHNGLRKGYITEVSKRTFRDSIHQTSGAY